MVLLGSIKFNYSNDLSLETEEVQDTDLDVKV
jgi:hypothetical protein